MAEDCLGRVAARATRTPLWQFITFCPPGGPATLRDFYAYLLHHGYFCGLRLVNPRLVEGEIPYGTFVYGETDALVIVESGTHLRQHALFFHKESNKLLDCTAQGERVVALGESPILEWVPITQIPMSWPTRSSPTGLTSMSIPSGSANSSTKT